MIDAFIIRERESRCQTYSNSKSLDWIGISPSWLVIHNSNPPALDDGCLYFVISCIRDFINFY